MNRFNHHISRRGFLKGTGLLAGGLAASPAWALSDLAPRGSGFRRLIVVELHGGNDGLNCMAPSGDDLYHRARPNLAIGPKDGHELDGFYRWHPSLINLAQRFTRGQICAVQGVGTAPPNLSHFRSRDVWYQGTHTIPEGELSWLGRLADRHWGLDRSPVTLLNVGQNLSPKAMQSGLGRPFHFDQKLRDSRLAPEIDLVRNPAHEQLARLQQGSQLARQASQALAELPNLSTSVPWPRGGFGGRLAQVATAIAHDLPTRVFWVSQAGYDTHSFQAKTHAHLLRELDQGLHALLEELESRDRLKDTLIMTMSEFGRRVAENGSKDGAGTDHGLASVQWLMGGHIKGGLLGPRPDLTNLDGNGNLHHAYDFRQVNGAVVRDWFGVNPKELFTADLQPLPIFATPKAIR